MKVPFSFTPRLRKNKKQPCIRKRNKIINNMDQRKKKKVIIAMTSILSLILKVALDVYAATTSIIVLIFVFIISVLLCIIIWINILSDNNN